MVPIFIVMSHFPWKQKSNLQMLCIVLFADITESCFDVWEESVKEEFKKGKVANIPRTLIPRFHMFVFEHIEMFIWSAWILVVSSFACVSFLFDIFSFD